MHNDNPPPPTELHHVVLNVDATLVLKTVWGEALDMPMVSVRSILKAIGVRSPEADSIMHKLSYSGKYLCHVQTIQDRTYLLMPLTKLNHFLQLFPVVKLPSAYQDNMATLISDGAIAVYNFWYGTSDRFIKYQSTHLSLVSHYNCMSTITKLVEYADKQGLELNIKEVITAFHQAFAFVIPLEKLKNLRSLTLMEDIKLSTMQTCMVTFVESAMEEGRPANDIITNLDAVVLGMLQEVSREMDVFNKN